MKPHYPLTHVNVLQRWGEGGNIHNTARNVLRRFRLQITANSAYSKFVAEAIELDFDASTVDLELVPETIISLL